MASNDFLLGLALQSGKDAVAAAPQWRIPVRSIDIKPNRETAQMEQTGLGRDGGRRFVTVVSASGNFEIYLFPEIAPLIGLGVFGSMATRNIGTVWAAGSTYAAGAFIRPVNTGTNPFTFEVSVGGTLAGTATEPAWGTAPNEGDTLTHEGLTYVNRGDLKYGHLATPASDQPYFTLWRMFLSDGLTEKFHNIKFTSSNFTGSAGQLITVQTGVQGLKAERLTSIPAGGTVIDSTPLRVPGAVYNRDSAVDDAIREWNMNITANQEAIQTNKLYYSYIKPGSRNIEFNFTEVFEDLGLYNQVLYGSAGGTQVSEELYEADFTGTFGRKPGPAAEIHIPALQYLTAPLDPSAGGEPLQLQVTGAAARPGSGPISELDFYNSIANYPVAAVA